MKQLSKMILWLGFPAVLILFSYLFSVVYRDTQISRVTWFEFEPNETYEVTGSQFFIDERKEVDYYTNVANFLKETKTSENSLGVKLSWDRRGSHFADIEPVDKKVVKGRLYKAGVWVWAGNFMHELSLIFSRNDGFSYGLSLGNFNFYGWRHLETAIPQVISSSSRYVDATDSFYFKTFRVYTDPRERINDIYVFIDKFDVDEEITFNQYDGYDLARLIQGNLKEEPETATPTE